MRTIVGHSKNVIANKSLLYRADSRLIYKATNSLLYKIDWDEWVHFGIRDEIKIEAIIKEVNAHLPFEEILFVLDRTHSKVLKRSEFLEEVISYFGKENFFYGMWTWTGLSNLKILQY